MYFLFQALGGFQCRHHELRSHEEGKPDIERPEEWHVGFDFIEEYGPGECEKPMTSVDHNPDLNEFFSHLQMASRLGGKIIAQPLQ